MLHPVRAQLAIYNRGQRKVFTFDRVYDAGATQEDVYEDTKPLIRSVLDGASLLPVQLIAPLEGSRTGRGQHDRPGVVNL